MLTLLNKIETFLARLKWKALFALNKFANNDENPEIPLFKIRKCPTPAVKEFIWIGILIIKFRKSKHIFQKKLLAEIGKINKTKKVWLMGDKTKKIYIMTPKAYKKKISEGFTKFYKKAPTSYVEEINK